MTDQFPAFRSIPRLLRDVVITEKIDGTNAVIHVADDLTIRAGSRTRWITPEQDNYGFARWVTDNAETLKLLGPGTHYGEWWGAGIQRRYGLTEKRFSLFNTGRWHSEVNNRVIDGTSLCHEVPCCHVVPILAIRTLDTTHIKEVLDVLARCGSIAAPGFMQPEGIVAYHTKSDHLYKVTLDKNDGHKGSS